MRSIVILVALIITRPLPTLYSQVAAGLGGLTGVVTDFSGASVPNAEVLVDNERLGIHRKLASSNGGVFNAPALVPSSGYQLTVNATGFAKFQNRNITVLVGQDIAIRAKLEVQTSTATVEVTDAAPVTEDKIDVSQNVTQSQIDNLPINGRRVDSFVLLTPTVVPDGTFGLLSFRGISGGNTFMTDGNDTTETFYGENAGRTRIPTQISQDAVQEFQVLSSAYSAEYGRATGGIVNTVTRSGSNQLVGTAFWFFRNRTLDARDPFSTINPKEARHQFGGSIGGPIKKNRLFFFLNTEEQRRDFPLVSSIINPSAIDGNSHTWIGCGVASATAPAATPAQCAAINATLTRFYGVLPRSGDQDTALGKIDWRPNDRNSFSLSFNYEHFNSPNGIQTGAVVTSGGAINSNGVDDVQIRYGRAQWTFVPASNIVNEARFGWFKDRQADSLTQSLLDPKLGALSLSVNGVAIGSGSYIPRIQPSESRFQFADNLSWTIGSHNFKVGVDYLNTEDYTNQLLTGNGSYNYSNPNLFALDYSGNTTGTKYYTSFQQAFGRRDVDAQFQDVAFFAQDQYRFRPNITLYYGVRYEYTFTPTPPLKNADYPQTGRIPTYGKNLGPRTGFSWAVNGGNTVIRGGYGLYYGRFPGSSYNSLFTTNNLYQQSLTFQTSVPAQLAVAPVFPNLLSSPAGTPGAATVGFAVNGLRTPNSQQADFSIQQTLGKNTSITASYIWSRAAHLITVRDLNLANPTHSVTYNILDTAGNKVGSYTTPVYLATDKIDSRYSRIIGVDNGGNSYYSGLALQLQHRVSNHLQGGLSYTWSHAIDNSQGSGGFSGNNAPSTLFNGDYSAERGPAGLDMRQRLVINWVYAPVFSKRTDLFTRFIINNWQLSDITTISTGVPVTESLGVTAGLNAAQLAQAGLPANFAFTGGTLNGFGGSSRVPFLGIGTLRLPNTYRTDVRLSKTLPFSERIRTSLSFEVFNLTNTIVYTSITNRAYTANGFNISPATGLGTPTQSSGFPDGTNARRAQAGIRIEF
jgi:outer membrane receptor protein involved in Fe transport